MDKTTIPKLTHTTILDLANAHNPPIGNSDLEKAILAGAKADTSRQDKPVDDGNPSPASQQLAVEAPPESAPKPRKVPVERGRFYTFLPTGDKVTMVTENIGQDYHGGKIHEVCTDEGHKFLSSGRQLGPRKRV